jgi:tRNA1(Val) A37 N6-methylase TrmN6
MSLDQPSPFVKHQTETSDAFLGGRLILSQPKHGFRAGLDSVILGASVAATSTTLLDLGAGVGTASFVALAHATAKRATLAEYNPVIAALARENAANNGFAEKCSIIEVDVAAKGSARIEAGMAENAFDTVIANPPFFAHGAGTLAKGEYRSVARHMDEQTLDLWVKTAATSAAAGGEVIFVYPATSLAILLASFTKRFGAISILPLCPRAGEPASRVLVRGIKGSRAPLSLLASRNLHLDEGRHFAPGFEAIFRGTDTLHW